MEVSGNLNIGRPKLRWSDIIRTYMTETGVRIEKMHRTG